jgi:hypothetical protein
MRPILPLLLVLIGFGTWTLDAQNCVPDPQYADSTGFVFPPPYHPVEEPDGGIQDPACIGAYYEFQWTINTPDTVLFPVAPGFEISVALEYLKLSTSGAISNLPEGINYICNPPNCQFNVGELGCVLLYGTPTANNVPGSFDLYFTGQLKTKTIGTLNVNFPDPNLYPGNYFLEVLASEDPQCLSSIADPIADAQYSRMIPNPVLDWSSLEVRVQQAGAARLEIMDLTGRAAGTWNVLLSEGINQLPLDLSGLQQGFWLYRLETETGVRTTGSFVRASW